MIAGTGLERVDAILKGGDAGGAADPAILAPDPDGAAPDLEGLSCRWQPLAASRGRMIALMVAADARRSRSPGATLVSAG